MDNEFETGRTVPVLAVLASQSALAQNQRVSHNASALRSRNYHPAANSRSLDAVAPASAGARGQPAEWQQLQWMRDAPSTAT